MIKRCHKQDIFVDRIQKKLGVKMGSVSCKIVDQDGMSKVMGKAGWSRNETFGVVGFQVDREVYVLEGAPWTVLHELIHRAGVNADRLNRFVAEGLTEAIAEELAQSPDEHRPTYPVETRWVKGVLLPRLGMSAVQLGGILARCKDPPGKLAGLMAQVSDKSASELRRKLAPQVGGEPSFNRRGKVSRDDHAASLGLAPPRLRSSAPLAGGVLIALGLALIVHGDS